MLRPDTGIYFIEAVGLGLVKIGKSKALRGRIQQLKARTPCELRVLKVLPGRTAEEAHLHKLFAEHRVHGEWFRLEPIRVRIEQLDGTGFLSEEESRTFLASRVDAPGDPVVSARIPAELAQRLQAYIDHEKVTLTEAVRRLLEKGLNAEPVG